MRLALKEGDVNIHLISTVVCGCWTRVRATWIDKDGWTRTIEGAAKTVGEKVNKLLPAPPGPVVYAKNYPKDVVLEVDGVLVTDPDRWEKLDDFNPNANHTEVVVLTTGGLSFHAVEVR